VLVPGAETPLSVVQLRQPDGPVAEGWGAVVLPAMPAFYTRPAVAGRRGWTSSSAGSATQLGVAHQLFPPLGERRGLKESEEPR